MRSIEYHGYVKISDSAGRPAAHLCLNYDRNSITQQAHLEAQQQYNMHKSTQTKIKVTEDKQTKPNQAYTG